MGVGQHTTPADPGLPKPPRHTAHRDRQRPHPAAARGAPTPTSARRGGERGLPHEAGLQLRAGGQRRLPLLILVVRLLGLLVLDELSRETSPPASNPSSPPPATTSVVSSSSTSSSK